MANGYYWLAVLCYYKSVGKIKINSLFICAFNRISYICTHKKGLVAQLNSALDYGSRGYWFESSQGHLRMESADFHQRFFCIKIAVALAHKSNFYTKKVFQSLIEKHFSLPLRSLFWMLRSKIQLWILLHYDCPQI